MREQRKGETAQMRKLAQCVEPRPLPAPATQRRRGCAEGSVKVATPWGADEGVGGGSVEAAFWVSGWSFTPCAAHLLTPQHQHAASADVRGHAMAQVKRQVGRGWKAHLSDPVQGTLLLQNSTCYGAWGAGGRDGVCVK